LSCDDRPDYEEKLRWTCDHIHLGFEVLYTELKEFPSIQMGLETAFLSLTSKDSYCLFPSKFTKSKDRLPINGLIWMGDHTFMLKQLEQKLAAGFDCIKMKVGALDFDQELALLKTIRERFSKDEIVLRVDANGAFSPEEASSKLDALAAFDIHSIEQPIKQHQWENMAHICSNSPIPIALDEELIGIYHRQDIKQMLEIINPQYIILKPSLLGGLKQSNMFIEEAENYNIGWWVTSALESNIGLNTIAQWVFTLNSSMPQGLGTGQLFHNNITSPLIIKNANLYYDTFVDWDLLSLRDV
jgi:o-succinylbenzoate synthase